MRGATIFLAAGTRGDIQPLVALALALEGAGRPARLVAPEAHRALAEGRGLAFASLDGDLNELLAAPAAGDALVASGRPLAALADTLRFVAAARPLYARMLASAWEHARGSGAPLVVATLPTAVAGAQVAEALGVPLALALLQPAGATARFASPLLPVPGSLGPHLNRASHGLVELVAWLPWRREVAAWRRGALGLPPLPASGPLAAAARRGVRALYGYSELVAPRPPDWPAWRAVCGYWPLAAPEGWRPPAELERFLEAGPPPAYVGFGSMGARGGRLPAELARGLREAGLRGVLAGARLPAELAGPDILEVGEVWHDWLLPRTAAAVHHGGAGTTAAALRAGAPSVVAPVGVDQAFWGRRVAALGCGPAPVPQRALTAPRLASLLAEALGEGTRARAAALGARLRAEDGLAAAAAELLRLL